MAATEQQILELLPKFRVSAAVMAWRRGADAEELYAVASLALVDVARRWDGKRPFATFAGHRVAGAMRDHLRVSHDFTMQRQSQALPTRVATTALHGTTFPDPLAALRIAELLRPLSQLDRRILHAHYIDDLSMFVIAAREGISRASCVFRAARARRHLRELAGYPHVIHHDPPYAQGF
ncbi:MAG: hypothetical protein NVS9B4_00600 [Candidatus Acidiferrum sp.]